jgi:hypothetical protein
MAQYYINLPVSYGEAIDKLTILDIKLDKIKDDRKNDVKNEYDAIYSFIEPLLSRTVRYYYSILKEINLSIWDMQDTIRSINTDENTNKEKICIDILHENDRRFRVKSKINTFLNSSLKEQKGYTKKRSLLMGHLGLGDSINLNGMVRYYSTVYDEITVICNEKQLKSISTMYSDDPTIKVYPVKCIGGNVPQIDLPDELKNNIDIYKVGYYKHNNFDSCNTIPFNFYDDANISRKYFWSYFHISDVAASFTLYKEVFNICGNNYILIHTNATEGQLFNAQDIERKFKISPNETVFLNTEYNVYTSGHPYYRIAEMVVQKPFIDYIDICKYAKKIIVTDSFLYCLALHIDIISDESYVISRDAREYEYIWKEPNAPPLTILCKQFKNERFNLYCLLKIDSTISISDLMNLLIKYCACGKKIVLYITKKDSISMEYLSNFYNLTEDKFKSISIVFEDYTIWKNEEYDIELTL